MSFSLVRYGYDKLVIRTLIIPSVILSIIPFADEKNSKLYQQYKALADQESNVIFGGRLGEYKYYDMDQVIATALDRCESIFEGYEGADE